MLNAVLTAHFMGDPRKKMLPNIKVVLLTLSKDHSIMGLGQKMGIFVPKGTSGRLSECIENWRILTSDPEFLSLALGYKIHFLRTLFKNLPELPQHQSRVYI